MPFPCRRRLNDDDGNLLPNGDNRTEEGTWIPPCLFSIASYAFTRVCECVFARWCTDGVFAQNRLAPLTGFGLRARSPFCKRHRSKKTHTKNVLDLFIHTDMEKHEAAGNNGAPSFANAALHTHTHAVDTRRLLTPAACFPWALSI